MENKRVKRPQLRTLICQSCGKSGLPKAILWGMPEEGFDFNARAAGGCVLTSVTPPGSRCAGCLQLCYRDEVSGLSDREVFLIRD